jgi:hypothetical protein
MNPFNLFGNKPTSLVKGVIDYGGTKKNGSHDHRFNIGDDRTQAQKAGDKKPGKAGKD